MAVVARDERGAVTAHVAVVPAVVALFFLVVQVGLWFHGRTVATAAAQHGLETARVAHGSAGAGEATVHEFVGQVGGVELRSVSVQRSVTEVTVTVNGDAVTVLPFFDVPITVTVEGPVERIVE